MARLNSVLGRTSYAGAGATSQMTPPPSSSPTSAVKEFRSGVGDVTRGRVSLLMLDSLILLLVVFYIWTHQAQGGG
jgi:hypothetical protein